jgi:hypothetical protein
LWLVVVVVVVAAERGGGRRVIGNSNIISNIKPRDHKYHCCITAQYLTSQHITGALMNSAVKDICRMFLNA